jgi:hypothetical protein
MLFKSALEYPIKKVQANKVGLILFENRVLRIIFGLKRDQMIGGWRKVQNEELHNMYDLLNIIRTIKSRRMRWAGHTACIGLKRNAYRLFVGKSEGNRPLGIHICRWEDTIKMNLRETGWNGLMWLRTGTSGGLQ